MKSFTIIIAMFLMQAQGAGQSNIQQATVLSAGGGSSASTSYKMILTVGQPLGGVNASSSFQNDLGFWYLQDAIKKFYAASYSLSDGWNMVSVPRTVLDYRKKTLFPSATTAAFAYTGSYKQRDTLSNGAGYWLKFPIAQRQYYNGTPRNTDTVDVKSNWNIIGSISQTVAVNAIVQDPPEIVTSQYFNYGGAYHSSSVIEPGKAYWVKTSATGKLILNATTGQMPSSVDTKPAENLAELNTLTVSRNTSGREASVQAQSLLFGRKKSFQLDVAQFEMPPTPPAGTLDARFGSNRYLELLSDNFAEQKEIPLLLQSDGGPVTLSWQMKERDGVSYALLQKKGVKITRYPLTTNGSVTILPEEGKTFSLKVENVPTTYALYQNYPNPFNPSTTIRYDLPEASIVTIKIFNILGQEVSALLNLQQIDEGTQTARLDGSALASGTYFYKIEATGLTTGKLFHEIKKMLLIK